MPFYNGCSIYDSNCRDGLCDHGTNDGIKKRCKACEKPVQAVEVQNPTYSLTGLSEADCDLLIHALVTLNDHATVGVRYDLTRTMIDRIYEAQNC